MATLIGSLTVVLTAIMALSSTAVAWNIPGHMLSGITAYQVFQQENPPIIEKVKAVLAGESSKCVATYNGRFPSLSNY